MGWLASLPVINVRPATLVEGRATPAMHVLGRRASEDGAGPVADFGRYRARDGSSGARVAVDLDRPHVVVVVGKRGAGKSHTLGVLAEGLARADGTTPVVGDTMGVFDGLAEGSLPVQRARPAVPADALDPRAWCDLFGLDPQRGPGSLIWRAAAEGRTLGDMRTFVEAATADDAVRRAARNYLDRAASWGIFAETPLLPDDGAGAVVDFSGLARAAMDAVCAGVAGRLYRRCVERKDVALPWLLLDEAHAFFDGVAGRALRRLVTRGRQPGVSVAVATQRPSALPAVAVSQADLFVVHQLTSLADRDALADARPSYVTGSLAERMPTEPGEALVVDDATEAAHALRVRERDTPHGGASPRASGRTGRRRIENAE
jgi:DNA helicase HerA-like ATPase